MATFSVQCDALHKSFVANGPTAPGVSLTEGLRLLAEYKAKLAGALARRDAFMNAERLFDLPLSRFGQLSDMATALESVSPLFNLYADQLAFVATNSATLWADLDMVSQSSTLCTYLLTYTFTCTRAGCAQTRPINNLYTYMCCCRVRSHEALMSSRGA